MPRSVRANRRSVIHYPAALRRHWPKPLARIWRSSYPQIFDDDDLRLALSQPQYHFVEWLSAVHLFHSQGLYSLQSKYAFQNHPRKREVALRFMSERGLRLLRSPHLKGQPPDLLVYRPGTSEFWFVEVKGPHDRNRPVQQEDQRQVSALFHCPVDEIRVREVES